MLFVFDTNTFSCSNNDGKRRIVGNVKDLIVALRLLGHFDEDATSYSDLIVSSVDLSRSLNDFIIKGHDFKDSFRST